MSNISIYKQGRNSAKKIRGPGFRKSVGRHGWSTEKIFVFQWPKTAQMASKFLCFFRKIFKFRIFLVCQNNFGKPFSSGKPFFS